MSCFAGIQRLNEYRVLLGDEAATYLACTGQLVIIRIELFVQDQKAVNLRVRQQRIMREIGVYLLHAICDQLVHRRLTRQIGIAAIRKIATLGPVADGFHVDIDERVAACLAVAKSHRFLDEREELQFVLDVLGREHRAIGHAADIFCAVNDLQVAVGVEEAGVAGMKVTLCINSLGGIFGSLVVLDHQTRRADQHLATLSNLHFNVLHRLTDRIEFDVTRALHADGDACFGHAVQLLQINANRTVEIEQVGADRLATGVRHTDTGQAEHILQRTVNEHIAERIEHAIRDRHTAFTVKQLEPGATRDAHEEMEHRALDGACVLDPDHDLRQRVLVDARRAEVVGGTDFAQVAAHRHGRLGAVQAETNNVRQCVRV